jgi:hypothetical protein
MTKSLERVIGGGLAISIEHAMRESSRRHIAADIPAKVNVDLVKSVVLRYAKTEVEDEGLHPECLIATMPYAQAAEWQTRLRDMDEGQRCADQDVLLDEKFAKQLNKGKVSGCRGRLTSPNF